MFVAQEQLLCVWPSQATSILHLQLQGGGDQGEIKAAGQLAQEREEMRDPHISTSSWWVINSCSVLSCNQQMHYSCLMLALASLLNIDRLLKQTLLNTIVSSKLTFSLSSLVSLGFFIHSIETQSHCVCMNVCMFGVCVWIAGRYCW